MELWIRTDLNQTITKGFRPLWIALICGSFYGSSLNASIEKSPENASSLPIVATMPAKFRQVGAKYAKIRGSKVRMRQKPTLDSPIIRQMQNGEAVFIGQEVEGFTEVFPSDEQKAYVFRTYILDNQVEGKKVNVRLAPSLKAPIVAQLSQGDRVEGRVSPESRKWLEIEMPISARFYIYSKYLELITEQEYQSIVSKKEIAAPSAQKEVQIAAAAPSAQPLAAAIKPASTKKEKLQPPKVQPLSTATAKAMAPNNWTEIENRHFESWKESHPTRSFEEYERSQILAAHEKSGLLTRYDSKVINPPGDYQLELSTGGKIFIYSHKVDLSEYLDQHVRLLVLQRDAADFAWPAFVVVDVQDIDNSAS